MNYNPTQRDIDDVVIGAIGYFEQYMNTETKGFTAVKWYLTGFTKEVRQKLRDSILSTDINSFKDFAKMLGSCLK